MQRQIISDIAIIDKPEILEPETIENILISRYGILIRWAIIEVLETKLKISITYEKSGK